MDLLHRQISTLTVLHREQPNGDGGRFIEIRRWETPDGDHSELVVEHGQLEGGELLTRAEVAPFHFTVDQALAMINGGKAQ